MSESEKKPDQVFVVQLAEMDDATLDKLTRWVDVATVTIPANTPRRIAVKQALESVTLSGQPRLRALDAESAKVFEPEAYTPPMEWKL